MSRADIKVALRVDVDTLRGTRLGVPSLLDQMKESGIRASFFFSVGPDNMGRNLYRLFNPVFLGKMLRSGAPSLYGWDILLMGTLGPGPLIHKKAGAPITRAAREGHEIGVHAWDHFTWQNRLHRLSPERFAREFQKAHDIIAELTGVAPSASANPAWRSTDAVLAAKDSYPFHYHSDTRGPEIFRPLLDGKPARVPQVPVTLPTFDEIVGREGVTLENFNRTIIDRLRPGALNVYTIHAEVEGVACRDLFRDWLGQCRERGIEITTLGRALEERLAASAELPCAPVRERAIPGRQGAVAMAVTDS